MQFIQYFCWFMKRLWGYKIIQTYVTERTYKYFRRASYPWIIFPSIYFYLHDHTKNINVNIGLFLMEKINLLKNQQKPLSVRENLNETHVLVNEIYTTESHYVDATNILIQQTKIHWLNTQTAQVSILENVFHQLCK